MTTDKFESEIDEALEQAETDLVGSGNETWSTAEHKSLVAAREIIQTFQPVPQIIWRLVHFSISRPGQINQISEGMVFGLKKLVLAAASDPVIGKGKKITSIHEALSGVSSDVLAACSVIHSIGKRLRNKPFEQVWGPILDDAIVRSRIGMVIGAASPRFGAGRGMLAGICGRIGLAILIATGTKQNAHSALTFLSRGLSIREVAFDLYGCDPIQLAAMLLSAAGCGRHAAVGVASFSLGVNAVDTVTDESLKWFSALAITESARAGTLAALPPALWDALEIVGEEMTGELEDLVDVLKRRGHGWPWLS